MNKELQLAYDLINAFTQWFLYHHMDFNTDIQNKIERLEECRIDRITNGG